MDRPNPFPVRQVADRPWEVYVLEPPNPRWVACESEADARLIAAAPQLRYDSVVSGRTGEEFAVELERLADTLKRHRMSTAARFFRGRAKAAREPGAVTGT